MQAKQKIILFYVGIGIFACAILFVSFTLSNRGKEIADQALSEQTVVIDVKKEIENPIKLTDLNGEEFDIASLRGKVWTVNEFFASCPMCVDNYKDHLVAIHKHYQNHPDFRMVSISIDPRDTPERIRENLANLDVDFSKWLFLTGDQDKVREFLVEELVFLPSKERDGQEAVEKGKFAHDMALLVVDKNLKIRLKRDLFNADNYMPGGLAAYTDEVIQTIGALLQDKDERPRGQAEQKFLDGAPIKLTTPQS